MVCFFYAYGNEKRGKSSKDLPLITKENGYSNVLKLRTMRLIPMSINEPNVMRRTASTLMGGGKRCVSNVTSATHGTASKVVVSVPSGKPVVMNSYKLREKAVQAKISSSILRVTTKLMGCR